jgi:hypothetical protein
MKKIVFLFVLAGVLVFSACQNQNTKKQNKNQNVSTQVDKNAPVMSFTTMVHDFGKMDQGEIVKYTFHFKNTGKTDLKIARVSTSCGCTVGKYPHEPVKPGEEGDIEVTFNSSHKMGYQNKSVMLLANTKPSRTVLRIKAIVNVPKDK